MTSPTTLVKGQNAPVTSASVQITVDVQAPADLSALLVTDSGKVRSDSDFVFFNAPDGPGVRCVKDGNSWRLQLQLDQIPTDIQTVRAVVNLGTQGQRFGQVAPPLARIADAAGSPIAEYQVTGLDSESIMVAVELYRRGTDWKVRAVGQGYAGGLADLISDHGVSVDDAPAAPPAPAPPPASFPPPVAAQPAPSQPPAAFQPPPPHGSPPGGYPPPPAGAPAGFPPPSGVPVSAEEAGLSAHRPVSLQKGQRVSLRKESGGELTVVRMGLGWDPVQKRGMFGSREVDIDLDASAVMFGDRQMVDVAFYNNLRSTDGAIQHLGDNRTGAGEGDDETMLIDLTRVSAHITSIVFIVTSYEGQSFEQVQNAFCRLIDNASDAELARYTLSGGMAFTGMVMAKVYRDGGGWKMQAIGEGMQAKTPSEAFPVLPRFL